MTQEFDIATGGKALVKAMGLSESYYNRKKEHYDGLAQAVLEAVKPEHSPIPAAVNKPE